MYNMYCREDVKYMERSGFGFNLTVKEFYQYMVSLGAENFQMQVQYRDDGGDYYGEDKDIRCQIDEGNKTVTL